MQFHIGQILIDDLPDKSCSLTAENQLRQIN